MYSEKCVDLVDRYGIYVVINSYEYATLIVNTSRSFRQSWLIAPRLTRWVPIVDEELLTLPEHLISPPVLTGVRVTRSLDLYVCFVGRCLSFCTFSFDHCVVCSSSIYECWLPLWYLQTLLKDMLDFAQQISTPFGTNYYPERKYIINNWGLMNKTYFGWSGVYFIFIFCYVTTYHRFLRQRLLLKHQIVI